MVEDLQSILLPLTEEVQHHSCADALSAFIAKTIITKDIKVAAKIILTIDVRDKLRTCFTPFANWVHNVALAMKQSNTIQSNNFDLSNEKVAYIPTLLADTCTFRNTRIVDISGDDLHYRDWTYGKPEHPGSEIGSR